MPYANNKDTDQPAHPRSLISAFVVRCLDSIIPLVSISKTASLDSEAEQDGVSLIWSQILKTGLLVTRLILYRPSLFFKHKQESKVGYCKDFKLIFS